MPGQWLTGDPLGVGTTLTPYRYSWHAQAEIWHWAPEPSGGYPTGGAAGIVFLHGGNFTSGTGSYSGLAISGLPGGTLLSGDSDTFPVHLFHINVRQARTWFAQGDFRQRRYPSWAADVYEGMEDVVDAFHFLYHNAAALDLNPEYLVGSGNSAGTLMMAAACYGPDGRVSTVAAKRFDRRNPVGMRPKILHMQNAPYIPYLLQGDTMIDHAMLSGIFGTGTTDRRTRWADQLTQIKEISGLDLARVAFANEGYAPIVQTDYDNAEFAAAQPANFTQGTAHTAICGYHFHKMLADELGYTDTKHRLSFTGSVPGGAAGNVWSNNIWVPADSWDWLKDRLLDVGYDPNA